MSFVIDIIAGAAILSGSIVVGVAALGLVRLRDPFMRMHAATKAGVVGSGLIVIGSALALGGLVAFVLGSLCVVFLLVTSPIASHALGRAAYVSGAPIAPETLTDALGGVLPRNVFDISPGRTSRVRARAAGALDSVSPRSSSGVHAMSALESPRAAPEPSPAALQLRGMTVWLTGGDCQPAAIETALALAQASNAKLVGLSALDPSVGARSQMVPVGGLAWAKWLSDYERIAHRERSAQALASFENRARLFQGNIALRHAEGSLDRVLAHAAGNDLIVVPALVDHAGRKAHDGDELSACFSAHGVGPVLRVARHVATVCTVVMPVAVGDASGRAVQALIRTGLWRDASLSVIPVGSPTDELALTVARHIELLTAHGYRAVEKPAVRPDADREILEPLLGRADACVAAALNDRRGPLDLFRIDVNEFAATRVPLFLLP